MPTFQTLRPRSLALVTLGLAATMAACKGLTSIDASFQNVTMSDTVYALNGGPPGAPNTVKFFDMATGRADQGFGYDVAFDLDAAGNIRIIPVKAMATTFNSPYSVGLQRMTGAFEQVLEAPRDGYRADTTMVVGVDQPVVLESHDFGVCLYALKGQSYFSKLVINEIDPALKRIIFTMTVNRNCGFRSFAPGIPRD